MRPATLRRLLVFGVCLVGVGCLYLVPGLAGSPSEVGSSSGRPAPLTTPTVPGAPAGTDSASGSPALPQDPAAPADTTADTTVGAVGGAGSDLRRSAVRSRTGAIAVEPGIDDDPPDAVGPLTLLAADPDRLRIGWPAADDDRGVVAYQVWLNGFLVLDTQQTEATLSWFNDSDTHVVQVRAVDAAGNEGPSSPTLLVRRPTPVIQPSPSTKISTEPATSTSPVPAGNEKEDDS